MRLFEQAASQGDAIAQHSLGHMHRQGEGGAPVNFTKAREWYEKAAVQGHAHAQCNLGIIHLQGQGGPQDFIRARYWWEQAVAQGDANAMAISVAYAAQVTAWNKI